MFFYVVFETLYGSVNGVFDAGKSSSSTFLDTYNLSTSSLGCNDLCMVISFLVLWSICLSSSLVHLRKGPEYLTRAQPKYLFLWWGFCWRVLSRVVFAFSWDILFGSCLSFALVWWCQPPRYPSICRFHFLRAF